MGRMKRILAGMLFFCCLAAVCLPAGRGYAVFAEINGVRYHLFDPGKYYRPERVEKQAKILYSALAGYPEVSTYVYLVTTSSTVDVVNDISAVPAVYEVIREYFSKSATDYLRLESQEQYARYFYTTDHHWNHEGSYAGYCQMIRMMLGEEEPLLEPEETVTFPVKFNGSFNRKRGLKDSKEFFTVYRFDYPPMKTEINGYPKSSYGNQQAYLDGKYSRMVLANHYANFYGGDIAQLRLETERTDRDNLLVFSNSFSNAVAMLLASHFHNTWFIDLRYYTDSMKKNFSLVKAVKEWDIDRVLIIGDGEYFREKYYYER